MQVTNLSFGSANSVTPSDTAFVNCRAIYVGGTGNIALKTLNSATAVTFNAVPVGTVLNILLDGGQLLATGTTATLLIALS